MPAPANAPAPRDDSPRHQSVRWLRLGLLVAIILGLQAGGSWLAGRLDIEIWPRHSPMLDWAVLITVVAYVVTMSIPFVPGIEIGLAVMLMAGPGAIPAIYLCTQLALLLSFLVGRLVPLTVLARLAAWLHLQRASRLLAQLEPLAPADRLAFMLRRAPGRWTRIALRHRYFALAMLLNVPGNALIGGAGGIGLVAGMSRVFRLPLYIAVVALATTPLPILFLLASAN